MINATSAWHSCASWSAFLIKFGFLLANCCAFALAAYDILKAYLTRNKEINVLNFAKALEKLMSYFGLYMDQLEDIQLRRLRSHFWRHLEKADNLQAVTSQKVIRPSELAFSLQFKKCYSRSSFGIVLDIEDTRCPLIYYVAYLYMTREMQWLIMAFKHK